MLTNKQKLLLDYINKRLSKDGVCPSFDEMRQHLGLKSKSGIHRLIQSLEERGFIKRLVNKARALEILKLPEELKQAAENVAEMISVPLLGRIAAGTPIEAIPQDGPHLDLPPSLLGAGDHYALEVNGDSMTDAGIHDGDHVIIRRQERAEQGEIVVALVEGQEVTLKRFYKEGSKIRLQAESPNHQDQTHPADNVQVQGKLVQLLRRY